ncbi:MAG: hypothetical protein IGS48_11280 [Oscillatoriales cyanobacterium C42_A2020_001]|nr:hypothetical protein [Leptolyngbyaceae cyanobacterium C42_A2020_001]
MIDIIFFSQDKEEVKSIEVSTEFYQWLARSEFSRIGKSEEHDMTIDGESVTVPVIQLEGNYRRKFSDFFRDAIVQESDLVLEALSEIASKTDYQQMIYRLSTLQKLRKTIEDEQYKYLQRF